jgi:hypothetical protein
MNFEEHEECSILANSEQLRTVPVRIPAKPRLLPANFANVGNNATASHSRHVFKLQSLSLGIKDPERKEPHNGKHLTNTANIS